MKQLFAAILAFVTSASCHAGEDGREPLGSLPRVSDSDAVGQAMHRSFVAMLSDPARETLVLQRAATQRYLEESTRWHLMAHLSDPTPSNDKGICHGTHSKPRPLEQG